MYSAYCLSVGERVVLSIKVVCWLFVAMGCICSDRSEHVLLAGNEGKIECSKCMLRIQRRSIGFEGRLSSHSTDHEI